VVAAGDHDVGPCDLLHEVVQGCGGFEYHLARFRRAKLLQYIARRLHIALVADQQPDLPSVTKKSFCKCGHFGEVIGVNGIPITALLLPPAIGHYTDADTLILFVLSSIGSRRQREGDIRAYEIAGRGNPELLHEVVRNLIPVGAESCKRRGPANEAPAQWMTDGPGADRHKNHARAGEPRCEGPPQHRERPAERVLVEVVQNARSRHDDEVELGSEQQRAAEADRSAGNMQHGLVDGAQQPVGRVGLRDRTGRKIELLRNDVGSGTDTDKLCAGAIAFQELQHGLQRTVIAGIAGTKLPEKSNSHTRVSRYS